MNLLTCGCDLLLADLQVVLTLRQADTCDVVSLLRQQTPLRLIRVQDVLRLQVDLLIASGDEQRGRRSRIQVLRLGWQEHSLR